MRTRVKNNRRAGCNTQKAQVHQHRVEKASTWERIPSLKTVVEFHQTVLEGKRKNLNTTTIGKHININKKQQQLNPRQERQYT